MNKRLSRWTNKSLQCKTMPKTKATTSPPSGNSKANSNPDDASTFEQALEELESLVESMENDKAPLSELIENYEKGTQLYEKCQQHLDAAQQRVDLIRDGASCEEKKLSSFNENKQLVERKAQSPANTTTDDGQLF